MRNIKIINETLTFSLENNSPAVQGSLVDHIRFSTSRLHHETPSDSVKWIGHNTGNSGYNLVRTRELIFVEGIYSFIGERNKALKGI